MDPAILEGGRRVERPELQRGQGGLEALEVAVAAPAALDAKDEFRQNGHANPDGIALGHLGLGPLVNIMAPVDEVAGNPGIEEEARHSHILPNFSACSAKWAFSHSLRVCRSASQAARSSSVRSSGSTFSMAARVRAISSGLIGRSSSEPEDISPGDSRQSC